MEKNKTTEKKNYLNPTLVSNIYSWLNQPTVNKWFTFLLLFLSFIFSVVTFLVFTNSLPFFKSTPNVAITILVIDLVLLLCLCFKVLRRIVKIWIAKRRGYVGSKITSKFVMVFGFLVLIPVVIITIFSSLFFNLGMKTWFSESVQNVFEQSNTVANAYFDEYRDNIKSDILSMSQELNSSFDNVIFLDLKKLNKYISDQVELRNLTDAFIFKKQGAVLARAGLTISSEPDLITEREMFLADNNEIVFTSKRNDRVRALVKLSNLGNTYLVIGKFIDPLIVSQVESVKSATESYNKLIKQRSSFEIQFYVVFILISTLILLIAILIGFVFADNLVSPITNLIHTSNLIKSGNFNAKVPNTSGKDEMSVLIKTFNEMTKTLKSQQIKLRERERNAAWSDIARRIAHEIKNPLTPIQLSAEYLKQKSSSKENKNYADTIIRQVTSMEKMVDEFSKFARLPQAKFNICNLIDICKDLILLHQKANPKISFSLKKSKKNILINADESQISMAINNIIQNSIDSINERMKKNKITNGEINLNIYFKDQNIFIKISDNGIGLPNSNIKNKIFEPYITTKRKGSGLGLAIVLKIIQEHDGNFSITNKNKKSGVLSLIELPLKNNKHEHKNINN